MSIPARTSRTHPLDIASMRVLLGTVIVAIFLFIPSASVPFSATKTFVLALGAIVTLALYILARLSKGNMIVPASVLFCAAWLPAVAYALASAFSGVSFSHAFWGDMLEPDTLGFMLVAAVLGMLAALVIRQQGQLRTFVRAAAVTFGVLAFFETLAIIAGRIIPSIPSGFSIVGSLTDLAGLLGAGVIGSLLAFRLLDLSKNQRRWLGASSVAALFVLAIAGSALVWTLLTLVSLGLFVEAIMRRNRSRSQDDGELEDVLGDSDEAIVLEEVPDEAASVGGTRSPALPLVVLIVSLFFLVGSALGSALAGAFDAGTLNVRPSWQSTLSVAQKTYTHTPVFGSGPGTFGVQWLKYRDASLNATQFWNVDFSSGVGFIPTSFVTTGIVGVIAWVAFLLLLIVMGVRAVIWRAPEEAFPRFLSILSFVATLYFFTLMLFDLPSMITIVLAFVFAGVFISSLRYARGGHQFGIVFSRSPRLGFLVVFSLTLILLASVGAGYRLIEQYIAAVQITSGSTALSAGNLTQARQDVQASLSFVPMVSAYQLQAAIDRAQLNQIAASSTMSKTDAQRAYQNALSDGVNAALTATQMDPSDYQSWLALGDLYAQGVPLKVSGAYDSAKTAYAKAQTLNPTDPQIPFLLAQLSIANKDTKTAEADLKKAIGLKQDYTDAIFLLSQLEVQDGNIKGALDSALAAAYFTPNNPNILFQVGVLYAAQKDYPHAIEALSEAVAANPKFANARYLLAAVYAEQKDYADAQTQLKAVGALSSANAKAVAPLITDLAAGKNPFPANLLSASSTPVK